MPQSAIVPGILGGLGLISQHNANKEAENQANAQLALQQQMEQAQLGAYNNYMSDVGRLQASGAFNPASRLQELNQQGQYDLRNALGSEAGAARALGYRPGDSVPITQMNQTLGDYQLQQQQAANQIMNQANANYLAAIQGAPSLSDLGSGIGASSENARMFLGQEASPMGMLGAVGPYLQGSSQQNQPTVSAGPPSSQWNWSYDPYNLSSQEGVQNFQLLPFEAQDGAQLGGFRTGYSPYGATGTYGVDSGSGSGSSAFGFTAGQTSARPNPAPAQSPFAVPAQKPLDGTLPAKTNALSDSSQSTGGFGGVRQNPRMRGYGVFSAL